MPIDEKIHREDIFSPDRHNIFVNRFVEDYIKLEETGLFDRKRILKTLAEMSYVKAWLNTPTMMFAEKKLPKGYKWTDGILVEEAGGGRNGKGKLKYYLLIIGDDLWVKGKDIGLPGTAYNENSFVRVEDFRKWNGNEIADFFGGRIGDKIKEIYKDEGLGLGAIPKILKPLEVKE